MKRRPSAQPHSTSLAAKRRPAILAATHARRPASGERRIRLPASSFAWRPDKKDAGALSSALSAYGSDSAGCAIQQRSERLGFDLVGSHDRLDQRIRQKLVNSRTVV